MAVAELETDRGYADLALLVRPDMHRFRALDLLLEFKYLGLRVDRRRSRITRRGRKVAAATTPSAIKSVQTPREPERSTCSDLDSDASDAVGRYP